MKCRVKRHAVIQPQDPSYRVIPLTKGQNALIDTGDYDWLNQWNWHALSTPTGFYAARNSKRGEGGGHTILMHRALLKLKGKQEGDHENWNTLDNRRFNIRRATHSQNKAHTPKRSDNKSGYIGVIWSNEKNKWRANIRVKGKQRHLGYFNKLTEAAAVRDQAAMKIHGKFASLNSM